MLLVRIEVWKAVNDDGVRWLHVQQIGAEGWDYDYHRGKYDDWSSSSSSSGLSRSWFWV